MTEEPRGSAGEALPRLALAMGDPAGIGPEIVVKALAEEEIYRACLPVVIGDAAVLARAPGWGPAGPRIQRISQPQEATPGPGLLSVLDLANVPPNLRMAEASAEGGRACTEYLETATRLALAGHFDGVVFAPLNKEAMKKAGSFHLDEYGYFAELCGVQDYAVLTVGPTFTLASATMHVRFRDVADLITPERVLSTIRHGDRAARAAGVARPCIGVAALNPHAGEHATLGTEERDAIAPAVAAAVAEGIDAHGPFPADTFFTTVREPRYDVYVGMYHDQGRIAMKLLDFGRATTMAEGLPVLFCTVGHGTAFDIAGQGVARHENMKETILLAARRAAML